MSNLLGQAKGLTKLIQHNRDNAPVILPDDIREWTGYKPHFYQSLVQESEQRFNVEAFHRRFGKALDVRTPVPMADGSWKTMGDIVEGDCVLGSTGLPVIVLLAHKVMVGRPCYEVEFSCGEIVVSDESHLWETHTSAERAAKRPPSVRTTADIASSVDRQGKKNHRVRVSRGVSLPKAQLNVVDPYMLGVWLGDGSSHTGQVTTMDPEVFGGWRYRDTGSDRAGRARTYLVEGLSPRLRVLGVLNNKHIPEEFRRSSYGQRLALLQGLMDTDGTINKKGDFCEFCSCSERLAGQVADLARSLGNVVKVVPKPGVNVYRVTFRPMQQVFRLPYKADRYVPPTPRNEWRSIVRVSRAPSVPVRCLTVDAPDSLFLVGRNYIPTHNTYMKVNKLIERAVDCPFPNGRYAYVAPTYGMAEDIAWAYLLEFTEKFPNRKVEKAKLAVWVPTRIGGWARIRS